MAGLAGLAFGNREGARNDTRCPCRLRVEKGGRAEAHFPSRARVSGLSRLAGFDAPSVTFATLRCRGYPLAEALHRRHSLALDAPRTRHRVLVVIGRTSERGERETRAAADKQTRLGYPRYTSACGPPDEGEGGGSSDAVDDE
jgi:hypothetical protein